MIELHDTSNALNPPDLSPKQNWIQGRFLKRYKRFFADIKLAEPAVAHVANTGSLLTVMAPGQDCLVSPAENPERKLRYTLEALRVSNGGWVGVNTARPNKIVKAYLENQYGMSPFSVRGEYKVNSKTRLDFALLEGEYPRVFIEVKSVTMARFRAGVMVAEFPDAVTERGKKHLEELVELVEKGSECWLYFVVQRDDCHEFSIADDVDPEYGKAFRQALSSGLKVKVLECLINETGVQLTGRELPVRV